MDGARTNVPRNRPLVVPIDFDVLDPGRVARPAARRAARRPAESASPAAADADPTTGCSTSGPR
ncbi:MAG: hypothetical protein U0470_06185 [Anaerolineae bacterium]